MGSCSDNKFKQKLANFVQLPCDTLFEIQFQSTKLIGPDEKLKRAAARYPFQVHSLIIRMIIIKCNFDVHTHNTELIFHLLINALYSHNHHNHHYERMAVCHYRHHHRIRCHIAEPDHGPDRPTNPTILWWCLVSVSNFLATYARLRHHWRRTMMWITRINSIAHANARQLWASLLHLPNFLKFQCPKSFVRNLATKV